MLQYVFLCEYMCKIKKFKSWKNPCGFFFTSHRFNKYFTEHCTLSSRYKWPQTKLFITYGINFLVFSPSLLMTLLSTVVSRSSFFNRQSEAWIFVPYQYLTFAFGKKWSEKGDFYFAIQTVQKGKLKVHWAGIKIMAPAVYK